MFAADGSPLPWFLIAAVVLPLTSLVVVAWIVRRGRGASRAPSCPERRPEGGPERRPERRAERRPEGWRPWRRRRRIGVEARWTTATCRRCGVAAAVHEKTRLCDACHWMPLPSKEEVPDHLPERL